jgi:hypothetical protein
MVELVDTADSKSAASRRAGSIPALGTSYHIHKATLKVISPYHSRTYGFFYVRPKPGFADVCVNIRFSKNPPACLRISPTTAYPFDMTKSLLIFLMLLLPLQAIAAVQRNLGHVLGSGNRHALEVTIEHMVEHAEHVLHHHDDQGDQGDEGGGATHVDASQKSVQHLADCEQAGSMNFLLPAFRSPVPAVITRCPTAFWNAPFRTRSVLPLLRPPRLPA